MSKYILRGRLKSDEMRHALALLRQPPGTKPDERVMLPRYRQGIHLAHRTDGCDHQFPGARWKYSPTGWESGWPWGFLLFLW